MENDTGQYISIPSKRKLKMFWPCTLLILLFVLWFVWQLLGPNPAIRVGKETTHITSPLKNGLPDYDAYIRTKMLDGLEPSNNQSLAIWLELGPDGEDDQPNEKVSRDLGIPLLELKQGRLIPFSDERYAERLQQWLDLHEIESNSRWQAKSDLPYEAMGCNWSSLECPPLAAWLQDNDSVFNRLQAACFMTGNAPFAWAYRDQPSLNGLFLGEGMRRRQVARLLSIRARWKAGDGKHLEAWHDLKALHHLARTEAGNFLLVDYLVNVAVSSIAWMQTFDLLASRDLSVADARQICAELKQLPPSPSPGKCLDEGERLYGLGMSVAQASGQLGDLSELYEEELMVKVLATRLDWNVILKRQNERFDQLVGIANTANREKRSQAIESFHERLESKRPDRNRARILGGLVSCRMRSQLVADWMDVTDSNAIETIMFCEDRASIYPDFAEAIAMLTIHRREIGEYPESLDDVIIDGKPADVPKDFSGLPLQYEKTEAGFTLRSLGVDGKDDRTSGDPYYGSDDTAIEAGRRKTLVEQIRRFNLPEHPWP